jgi:hypothetical protein
MGIVLGALGGMGDAMQRIGATNQKALLDEEADARKEQAGMRQQQLVSDLSLEREKTMALFKQSLGNQERTAQTGRIDAAAGKIADEAVSAKRGIVQGGIVDKESWTPEQQATVDQSLEIDRKKVADDPKTRTKAAISTGDISPKDAAVLDQKSEADMTRLMLGEQRNQTMLMIAAGHDQTRQLVAGMVAASKKDNANKEDRVLVHQFLGQFDRKISGNQAEIRSLRGSLKNNFDEADKAAINEQIRDLEAANKNLEKAQMEYARESGVKVPQSVTPEPTPAPQPTAGDLARPTSMAEFAKLPKGARFVNPKDGKTYTKN